MHRAPQQGAVARRVVVMVRGARLGETANNGDSGRGMGQMLRSSKNHIRNGSNSGPSPKDRRTITLSSIGVPRCAAARASTRKGSSSANRCHVASAIRVAGCAVVGAIPRCTTNDGPVHAGGIILTGVQVARVCVRASITGCAPKVGSAIHSARLTGCHGRRLSRRRITRHRPDRVGPRRTPTRPVLHHRTGARPPRQHSGGQRTPHPRDRSDPLVATFGFATLPPATPVD